MDNLKKLVEELRENGDNRWRDLEKLIEQNSKNLAVSTPIGTILVENVVYDEYNEICATLITEEEDCEIQLLRIAAGRNIEDGTLDVLTKLWCDATDELDYNVEVAHFVKPRIQLYKNNLSKKDL